MLKPKSPQISFFMSGNYLYDRIVPVDHLLRKINQVVDFSFVHELVRDRYTPDFGRPAEDPEFMLRLCLLQYLYGDSDRQVIENARVNLAYKYFLGLAVDEEPPDFTTVSYFRAVRLGEEKFRQVFESIVRQCIEKGLVKGKRQIVDSTHIIADIAVTSLTGLVKLCRQNVIKEVERQKPGTARKLGWDDVVCSKEDRFARKEKHLDKELEAARTLLDDVTQEGFQHHRPLCRVYLLLDHCPVLGHDMVEGTVSIPDAPAEPLPDIVPFATTTTVRELPKHAVEGSSIGADEAEGIGPYHGVQCPDGREDNVGARLYEVSRPYRLTAVSDNLKADGLVVLHQDYPVE